MQSSYFLHLESMRLLASIRGDVADSTASTQSFNKLLHVDFREVMVLWCCEDGGHGGAPR